MYTRQLETFLVAAEKGSFNSAAEELEITPASVMKQVDSIEERLGVKLFIRTRQGVKLTEAGEVICNSGRKLIAAAAEAIAEARKLSGKERSIRIGTSLLNPCKPLIDLYNSSSELKKAFSVKIIPFEDDRRRIVKLLSQLGREIDLIVGSCGSAEWQRVCSFHKLGTYRVCVAIPHGHRLAERRSLSVGDLEGEVLMMSRAGETEELDRLRAELVSEHPEIMIEDTEEYYDAEVFNTASGRNCLLLTLDAWAEVHPSLITIPVEWKYEIPYGIIYAKQPSGTVEDFMERLK